MACAFVAEPVPSDPRSEGVADTHLVHSLTEAIELLRGLPSRPAKTFLIGGAQLYTQALEASPPLIDRILLTRVHSPVFDCDTFIPPIDEQHGWHRESADALDQYLGFAAPRGEQTERAKDQDVSYEFQLWTPAAASSSVPPSPNLPLGIGGL